MLSLLLLSDAIDHFTFLPILSWLTMKEQIKTKSQSHTQYYEMSTSISLYEHFFALHI